MQGKDLEVSRSLVEKREMGRAILVSQILVLQDENWIISRVLLNYSPGLI